MVLNLLRYGLLLPLVTSVFVFGVGATYIFNGLAASTWDTVEGEIVEAGFPTNYMFVAEGERIVSSSVRHSFKSPSATALAARYPVGSRVNVYFCNSDGTVLSVLEPGLHWDSLCVTILALVVAVFSWRGFRPVFRQRIGSTKNAG